MADEGVGQMSISEFDDDDVMMGCVRSCCPIVTLSTLFFNAEVSCSVSVNARLTIHCLL